MDLNPNESYVMGHILKLMVVFIQTSDHALALIPHVLKRLSADHLKQVIGLCEEAIAMFAPAEAPAADVVGEVIENVVDQFQEVDGTDATNGTAGTASEDASNPPAAEAQADPVPDPVPAAEAAPAKKAWKPPVKKA